jgi:hypothetical protein
MPLFTVTMKSNGSTSEKDRLSRAIHAASIAAGYPEDDLFQRFLSLGPSDFRVDLYYPALPKPRTDQMLMIEVLVSSGTDTNRKKDLVAAPGVRASPRPKELAINRGNKYESRYGSTISESFAYQQGRHVQEPGRL